MLNAKQGLTVIIKFTMHVWPDLESNRSLPLQKYMFFSLGHLIGSTNTPRSRIRSKFAENLNLLKIMLQYVYSVFFFF